MKEVKGRSAAPLLAFILDVVVYEECIVEQFDGNGCIEGGFQRCSEGARCRDTKRRPHHLAAAPRVVGE